MPEIKDNVIAHPLLQPLQDGAVPSSFEQMFLQIFSQQIALMIEKHRGYGPGNIAAFGERGVLIRANDKMERLKNLLFEGGTPTADESIEDTWMDLCNYAAIALACRRGWWRTDFCPPLLPERG